MLEQELAEKAPPDGPVLRIVSLGDLAPDPDALCSTEREWLCDQVRFLARVYSLDWFVRQESRGYAGLESMPDDELRNVYKRVGKAIECIKEGVSFEDAGLLCHDPGLFP